MGLHEWRGGGEEERLGYTQSFEDPGWQRLPVFSMWFPRSPENQHGASRREKDMEKYACEGF